MTCCGPSRKLDGATPGGGGAGVPGAWTFSDAGYADGVVTTTDATPVFVAFADLAAVGSALGFEGFLFGQRSNGEQAAFAWRVGGFARNAVGANGLAPVTFGPSGYTDVATPPWTTPGLPAGWGAAIDWQIGNQLGAIMVGVAGVTIAWRALVFRFPFWGAVLL